MHIKIYACIELLSLLIWKRNSFDHALFPIHFVLITNTFGVSPEDLVFESKGNGVIGTFLNWLKTFFSNRIHRVTLNGQI